MRRPAIVAACVLSFVAGIGATNFQQARTSRREPQFENEHMKVWKSIIEPNQPLSQHRHDHGRALIALTDGVADVVAPDGKVLSTYNWEKGKAYWLGADPPNETHADVNKSGKTIEVIVVELKKDR
jgi:quercetin dioxygenase-like cupin family protein